jgi:hypothetical protein
MNEKLRKLLQRLHLASVSSTTVSEQKEKQAELIQQYADEQALGFAKWVTGKDSLSDTWTDQGLLNGYHESQKP